jgi:hypothetical protein
MLNYELGKKMNIKNKTNKMIKRGAVLIGIGSAFPITYLGLYFVGIVQSFPGWGIYLWPTSILMLATEGYEGNKLYVAKIITASLVSNAIIWLLIGAVFYLLLDFRRSMHCEREK